MRSLNRAATIANLRERPGRRTRRTLGARPAISVREGREEMPELVALRAQVFQIRVGRRDLDRHALGDVQAVALQPDDLLRVVGEEPEVLHAQVDENLGADPVVAQVGLEAEGLVGFDGVLALILKLVRAHLVHETDPPPLLAHVHEHAPPLGLDDRECLLELRPAVAAARVKDIADQALGVDADQHRLVADHLPHHERHRHPVVHARVVRDRGEIAEVGGQFVGRDPTDQLLRADPVLDQVLDRDHREAVLQGELLELGHPRHPAVLVEDLADDAGRVATREPREVHGRLGVAGAAQDAARHRPEGQDVAAAVLGHEVDRLRRDLVGGHHEIALVLAVLVVNDHEDAPLADLLDRLLDGRKPRHVAPLSASDRTRYLPITSASTFVACPGLSRPRVVAPSVYGISITSKLMSPSPATVRLTPSTAPLAPTSLPASVTPACTPSRSVVPARASATTVPISSTIPVNIYSTSGGAASLPPTTPHRPPTTAASAHRLRRPRRRSNRALSDTLLRPLWLPESRPPPPGFRRRSA